MAFSRAWTLTFWSVRISIEHSIAGKVYSLFLKDPIHFTPVEDRSSVKKSLEGPQYTSRERLHSH